MKTSTIGKTAAVALLGVLVQVFSRSCPAVTTVFFDLSQPTNLVACGITSDTIRSEGYEFTYTRDKLFTGGVGLTNPIGRAVRIPWPAGLEAQAVTAGPSPGGARIDIRRQDGAVFDITAFTAKLLANTAGAGAAWEIMPQLNGEDGLPNPVMFNATGYYWQEFNYSPLQLTGYDAYKMTLYVDFAVMSLTVVDASLPPPVLEITQTDVTTLQLSWPAESADYSLEFTAQLPAANWSTVTNSVMTNGNVLTVEMPMARSQQWFRLRK